jgi:hypothetical protein
MKQRTVVIDIAGLRIGFIVPDSSMAERIEKRYAGWLVNKRKPVVSFACRFSRKLRNAGSGSADLTIRNAGRGHGAIERHDFHCAWDGRSGQLWMRQSIYSFDACLRALYCSLLPLSGGVFMHASAIADKRRGFVFAGRSGSGKTTLARLLKRNLVLNDEICALTRDGPGRIRVSGTPFWGEMKTGPAHRKFYPVAAVYCLRKSARVTGRERIGPQEALKRLLACACLFSREASDCGRILRNMIAIVTVVPVYELRFTRDAEQVNGVALRRRPAPP